MSYWTRERVVENMGQLFLMAFDGPEPSAEELEFFGTFRIGGLILFADNYSNPKQLARLTEDLQRRCAGDQKLFIAVDHEGGRVQRFRDGFTRIPPMSEFGVRNSDETEQIHRTIARELRSVGVNMNFAPVADLCEASAPGSIGNRSFGEDPARVSEHVRAAVRGLQSESVIACAKHFPGHGGTKRDSHDELPVITTSRNALEQRDLVPFKAAIAEGVETIMTAHVLYPAAALDDRPASLSSYWMNRVLRGDLAFSGVIVTDALEMRALIDHATPLACGREALSAGADIVLYYREAYQFDAFIELVHEVERGELDHGMLVPKLERVRRLKARYLA